MTAAWCTLNMSVDTALIFAHDARSRLQKGFHASIRSPAQTRTIPPGGKSITIVKHLFLLPTQISSMTMTSRSRRRGFPDVFCSDALSMPQTIPSLIPIYRTTSRIVIIFRRSQHHPREDLCVVASRNDVREHSVQRTLAFLGNSSRIALIHSTVRCIPIQRS